MSIDVTKDETDQRQFDATVVEGKDPNFHYRWARCGINGEARTNIAMHEMHGYEVVKRTSERSILGEGTRIKKAEDLDECVRWGDMVLMRTPKENYEARLARERAKIFRQTKGVAEAYKNSIAKLAKSEDNAFEEHRANPDLQTSVDRGEEKMTPQQLDLAMKLASGIEEVLEEER